MNAAWANHNEEFVGGLCDAADSITTAAEDGCASFGGLAKLSMEGPTRGAWRVMYGGELALEESGRNEGSLAAD